MTVFKNNNRTLYDYSMTKSIYSIIYYEPIVIAHYNDRYN